METLLISQTIFYIVASLAMLTVGVLLVIVIYYLICILRDTKNISDDVVHTYNRTKRGIKKIINSFNSKK
ncbi:MAG: hypothetical protein WC822_00310 [Candidatus Paceibacterota bacterium]|jgi:hypothetical protein